VSRFSGRRYWLVGASEGLGRALALKLAQAGAEVIVSARSAERLAELVAELPGPARAVACDVADAESVKRAAAEAGEVDGMVYLAGLYWPMKATEWDADKVAAMVDVNLTGAARAVGEVLPGMLARGRGHIVLTGSLSGFRGLPGAVGYGATKAGIMSLGETMRIDLKGTGVLVQNANPGFIKTRLTDKNEFRMPFLMEPEEAADHMMRLMRSDRFSSSFPWAFGAWFRFSQFLPDWLYYRIY
jgi:NADP-dependent 3-hydroxy acid dehydrogenase YdfG